MPVQVAALSFDPGTVLVLITLVVAPIAAFAFARSGARWREVGRGPMAIEPQAPAEEESRPPLPGDPQLRAEIRSLVLATNERRRRVGREPLDVEAETDRRLAAASPAAPRIP